jgi:hypothetical protein
MGVLEPYIDAHSHIWTPDVAHYPLAPGFKVEDMQPRSFTAEELLATCRPAGVGRVNLIQMSYYAFDKEQCSPTITTRPSGWLMCRYNCVCWPGMNQANAPADQRCVSQLHTA